LFSRGGWESLPDRIISGPIAKKNIQLFSRWFFASARETEVDPQGRIKIPQELIDHAGLDRDVVLIGVSDRIEIWAKEKWEEYYSKADTSFTGESGTFEELGF
jgi:MraZ protein